MLKKSIRYADNRKCPPQHSPHKKILFYPLISRALRRTLRIAWDIAKMPREQISLRESLGDFLELRKDRREKLVQFFDDLREAA